MLEKLPEIWNGSISSYPLLMLQAAAVIGILSVVLTFNPRAEHLLRFFDLRCGVALGVSGFLLIGLSTHFINLPSRPYLNTDLLFLGGLFGGWIGGGICWACILSARLLFGGLADGHAAAVDMGALALGGMLMHQWLLRKDMTQLALRDLLIVWGVKMGLSVSSALLLGVMGLIPMVKASNIALARFVGLGLSLLILGCLLVLLRREARERAAVAQQLHLARIDPLTGLPNRRALREYLDSLLSVSPDTPNTLITLELANICDMVRLHGHDWADHFWQVLVPVLNTPHFAVPLARHQPRCFIFTDLTLVLVLRDIALETAQQAGLAEHLQAELIDHLRASRPHEQVPQLRVGVAMGNDPRHGDAAPVLRNLNLALQSDTRPLRYFHHSFAEKAALDEELRLMLIDWISIGRAPLQYQPKCDLCSGDIIGAEALLRAKDRRGKPVSPPLVLEVARRNQLLIEFEWCTIETVVHDIGQGIRAGRPLSLAVNVSAASLTVPGFGERVVALLRATNTPSALLSVEITENSPVPDVDTVDESLQALSAAGVRLSLDDFGTGYSGLSMLARFPFNEVKIDHSMVTRLEQPRMRAAVSLAFESAQRYNATLVAEGVETRWQIEVLTALGISRGQGYFFARAMALDSLLSAGPLSEPAPLLAASPG